MAIYEVEINYQWLIQVEAETAEDAFDDASDLATIDNLIVTNWEASVIESVEEPTL